MRDKRERVQMREMWGERKFFLRFSFLSNYVEVAVSSISIYSIHLIIIIIKDSTYHFVSQKACKELFHSLRLKLAQILAEPNRAVIASQSAPLRCLKKKKS